MKNKLIVALDFPNIDEAKNLVEILEDEVNFYKIGLEMMMSGDYFEMIEFLSEKNKKIFADLKLYDIAETVGRAVKNLSKYQNIEFLTIHCASKEIMQQAVKNAGNIKILGVTVLTNLDEKDLSDMGFDKNLSTENLVLKKAKLAQECQVSGIVSSGFEAKIIRENVGDNLQIICPGIRLSDISGDDQKRVVDVKTAFGNGANYIVVGRPINRAENPLTEAKKFQKEIASFYG